MDNKELCEERHKTVNDKLHAHEKNFEDIFPRLNSLEKLGGETTIEVKNLCQSMNRLTNAIWWSFGVTFVALVGFVFWYIQSMKGT